MCTVPRCSNWSMSLWSCYGHLNKIQNHWQATIVVPKQRYLKSKPSQKNLAQRYSVSFRLLCYCLVPLVINQNETQNANHTKVWAIIFWLTLLSDMDQSSNDSNQIQTSDTKQGVIKTESSQKVSIFKSTNYKWKGKSHDDVRIKFYCFSSIF